MLIGAVMTALMWATAMTKNTLIGESVSNGALSFQTTGMSAQQTAALTAIFGLFAVCGIVAVLRGWTMLNGYYDNGVVFINRDLAGASAGAGRQALSDRLLKVALEEVAHYVTGATDNSRDFQDFLLEVAVTLARKCEEVAT